MDTESPLAIASVRHDPANDRSMIAKAPTGARGLDDVLLGGIPRGRATLVVGGPGTGKTILGLEFLYHGALAGEPGILLTFEEQAEALRRNAQTLGWDLAALERAGRLAIIDASVPTDVVASGEFDIGGLLAILGGQVRALQARRIVIDAADLLLRLFRDPRREEDQLIALHRWLLDQQQTVIITVKTAIEATEPMHRLEYLTDCVLRLDHRVLGQVSTRRLRVLKYRGSSFLSNEYPYVIGARGLVLMPVSTAALTARAAGARFPTGVGGLDRLLGGGFFRGSSVLIGGASGTGKTILACSIATTASVRGERVLYISFEESAESLTNSVRSAGVDLESALQSGNLQFLTSIPEAMGVEEHLWRIFEVVDSFDPQHLIVDSISACQRMGSEEAAFDFLVRLLTHCKARGTTCIFVNQTDPRHAIDQLSGVGISSLIDSLLVLRQDWPQDDTHRRSLLVVKVRGSRHAHHSTTFQISDEGIEIESARAQAPAGDG
jgi:circadian clock protein KaiC